MKRIYSPEELVAMAAEFIKQVNENFRKGKLICHPMAPVVYLPIGLKYIPNEGIKPVNVWNVFLYSRDGIQWKPTIKEMFEEVSQGGTYYIADLSLDRFYQVEEYMLEGLGDLLLKELDHIVYSESYHWKQGFIGEKQYMPFETFIDEFAL